MFSPKTALFVSMHLKEEEEVEELVMRAGVGVGVSENQKMSKRGEKRAERAEKKKPKIAPLV